MDSIRLAFSARRYNTHKSLIALIFFSISIFASTRYYFRTAPPSLDLRFYSSTPLSLAILRTTFNPPTVPLISRRNFWGVSDEIEFPDRSCFNPTLLNIPSRPSTNSNGSFVVVARDEARELWVGDKLDYVIPRSIIACLLNLSEDDGGTQHRWSPMAQFGNRCHSLEQLEKVVSSNDTFFPKCNPSTHELWYEHVQGPEDPRIFWSHLGEPLLVYNSHGASNSSLCRQMYLVDLRSVYPILRHILSDFDEPAPIRFVETVPLSYKDQTGLQKNWSPFTNAAGEVFFHTDLIPQTIYKLALPDNSVPTFSSPAVDLVTVELVTKSAVLENCITLSLDRSGYSSIRPGDHSNRDIEVHQSTPFLEVVLCTSADALSGACDGDKPENRVYMGLIHIMHAPNRPRYYERRIVILNSTLPFRYISVSKPLMYCMTPFSNPCLCTDMLQWE